MFFVFYPIDVLWLDKNNRVVQIKEHFKPFATARAFHPSKYIVELPDGLIAKTKTNLGDIVQFDN